MKKMTRYLLACGLLCILWQYANAKNGDVVGSVKEEESDTPIQGVLVQLRSAADTNEYRRVYSDLVGEFRFVDIPQGNYTISFSHVGHKSVLDHAVSLESGEKEKIDIRMKQSLVVLAEVVTSASRKPETVLDAPAGVTVLSSREIESRVTLSPVDHLQGVTGVDIAQKGVMQREFVVRGLNNVFNGSVLALTDNRIAGLPSLRANVSYLMPQTDEDIERMEVVRGPGSALYGPNATNGVLNIITKSPLASLGTSVSIIGGEQQLFQGNFRHAGVIRENFGFKLSGQYLRATDWPFPELSGEDNRVERFNGEARFDYLMGKATSTSVTAGWSQAVRNIDLTDNGAAQARNFRYYYVQGKFTMRDLFVNGYVNRNDAGETYIIETNQKVVDNSAKYVAEVQHSSRLGDSQRFTYGFNMYLTRPQTDGTIFGRNEDNDNIDEYGLYLQSDTQVLPDRLWLLLAGRIDWHSALEGPVVSPRAGLLVNVAEGHSLRLTYNRAYATPAASDLFLDLLVTDDVFGFGGMGLGDFRYGLRGTGVPASGYTFNRIPEVGLSFYSTFNPSQAVPVAGASAFWPALTPIVVAGVQDPELRELLSQFLDAVPQPSPEQVGGTMMILNTETGGFDPIQDSDVQSIPRLKPTINQTYEIGYKGSVGEKLELNVDVFYSKVEDFITSQQIFTPNVFLVSSDVTQYLIPYLSASGFSMDSAMAIAQMIGDAMGGVPLGTVTPDQAANRTEILLAPTNAGDIDYWGIDLGVTLALSSSISLTGTYSFLNKNYFEGLSGFGDLSLNAPKNKASLAVRYSVLPMGLRTELRYRFVDGFKMKSGVYQGTIRPYSLVDMSLTCPLRFAGRTEFTLTATNLLNHKHREFVGAPEIGRMIMGKLSYTF